MSRKNSSPCPPGRLEPGDLHPVLRSPFWEGFWVGCFGSPRISAAMPAPVACPDSSASCHGGARRHSVSEATQAKRWLKCQPSSYVRLEAYRFFGLSEGA